MTDNLLVLPDASAVAESIASGTADVLADVLSKYARASMCVTADGPFPAAYKLLAERRELEWDRVHIFWTNDRLTSAEESPDAIEIVRRALIEPAGIPEENVNAVARGLVADASARRYEADLEVFFGADGAYFDVMHLALAADGSVAGLHPDSGALDQRERRAFPTRSAGAAENDGVTLTLRVLNRAECCYIAAVGGAVSSAVAGALQNRSTDGVGSPASRVQPTNPPRWVLDTAAAAGLGVTTAM